MYSIRRNLLRNLLLLGSLAWLLLVAAIYWEVRGRILRVFDAQLAQASGIVAELALPELAEGEPHHFTWPEEVVADRFERKISFQIWEGDRLQMHSPSAPATRLSMVQGYSNELIGQHAWRVFARAVGTGQFMLYTAERFDVRDELIGSIARAAIYPMLIALPLVAFLIWLMIGRGLAPLARLAVEVKTRAPGSLDPLASAGIPVEVGALVSALNDLLARLGVAFERESRFTSDAAHELRTPLAAIRIQSQVAMRAQDAEERNRALARLVEAVDRGTWLVEQLLALARMEPQVLEQRFGPVDLVSLARNVIVEFSPSAQRKEVSFRVEDRRGNSDRRMIRGSAAAIEMLLRNLFDNSLRHLAQHGRIEVVVEGDSGGVQLSVLDNGSGVVEAEREQVLQRFYRGTREGYGSGLGLSIVARIAELHEATLQLGDGLDGKGLGVRISFPSSRLMGLVAE